MDRQLLVEKSKKQASSDAMCKGETEKKTKENNELAKLRKELKACRRKEEVLKHDFDRVQKTNKELVAKLEEVEKDKKFTLVELVKILDEERNKVFSLERVHKELVARLEEVEMDKKIAVESRIKLMKILDEETKKCVNLEKAYKSKILEEEEKLEAERKKNRALEEEVDKYKRLIDENDLIVKADETMEGMPIVERVSEKAGRVETDGTMFGSEDDTVYVDLDGFHIVGNF